ncbi:hypothetical protein KQ51_01550 [Candidatus Izimaplasma bacterium HR1]|jgi:chorismate mutase|uniref:PD-(D/E)XK nuclease family protein n=1 Tax=Candidatus Izimoplasma sp. HR1 TaxID=1541959 RepID=UPI0004F821D7|nr:hypothetical protein KQ51_01550 [Candidatus Izimaplasma bacterium HR1]
MKIDKDVILINNLFTGGYLSSASNIGHEFINIYPSDNGSFYIYANPYGNIAQKWDDRIEYVIFVRAVKGQKRLQIIGYAKVEQQILKKAKHAKKNASKETIKSSKALAISQRKYIAENNISYGGISLMDIVRDNDSELNISYFVTFKTSRIFKANQEIEFPYNDEGETISRTSETMKIYIEREGMNSSYYDKIVELIKKNIIWDQITSKVNSNSKNVQSLISVLRKNYDENVITNFLAYFLDNDYNFWIKFAKEILKLEFEKSPELIARETENRIDLFIVVDNHIIVIENKVKSSINGINKVDKKLSQLDKYFEYTQNYALKRGIPLENLHFYILRPNYNKEDISRFSKQECYKKITYSQIYDISLNHKSKIAHFEEFKELVKIHSSSFDNEIFDQQKEMLANQILKVKNEMNIK